MNLLNLINDKKPNIDFICAWKAISWCCVIETQLYQHFQPNSSIKIFSGWSILLKRIECIFSAHTRNLEMSALVFLLIVLVPAIFMARFSISKLIIKDLVWWYVCYIPYTVWKTKGIIFTIIIMFMFKVVLCGCCCCCIFDASFRNTT